MENRRDLTFTVYHANHKMTSEGRPIFPTVAPADQRSTLSWADWLEIFTTHEERPGEDVNRQKHGGYVVLGAVKTNPDDPSMLLGRSNSNLEFADAVGLDFDDFSLEEADVLHRALAAHPHVLYTTHKSKGFDRWRLIVPLRESIKYPDVWKNFVLRFAQFLGVEESLDQAAKDFARLHYLPSTYDAAEAKALAVAEGEFFDPSTLPPLSVSEEDPRSELPALDEDDLKKWRASLFGLTARDKHPEVIKAVAKGEPIPLDRVGGRHNAIRHFTWTVATSKKGRAEANATRMIQLLKPSFEAMDLEGFDLEREVRVAWEGALEKIEAERQKKLGTLAEERYTPEDLKRIAEKQGVEVEDLQRRWILARRSEYWVLQEDGDYASVAKEQLPSAIAQDLKKVGIQTHRLNAQGVPVRIPLLDILEKHESRVDRVVHDMTIPVSRYDAQTRKLTIAAIRIRPELEPEYVPAVDAWLQALAGDKYELLLDWLACAPDLSRPLCGLYLGGAKHVGKSTFAVGVAKLWSTEGSRSSPDDLFKSFNDALLEKPVVHADEYVPLPPGGKDSVDVFREKLGNATHTLSRKYRDQETIRFAVRLILTANNEGLLHSRKPLKKDDLDAIAERFAYIPCDSLAADLFEEMDPSDKVAIVEGDAIPRHILHLHKTRAVQKKARMWVEGERGEMLRFLVISNHFSSMVCEVLVRAITDSDPQRRNSRIGDKIRIQRGKLLVSREGIREGLSLYMDHIREQIDTNRLMAALRSMVTHDRPVEIKYRRYFEVDVEYLCSWAESNGSSAEEIRQKMRQGSFEVVNPVPEIARSGKEADSGT